MTATAAPVTYHAIDRNNNEIICRTRQEFADTIREFILNDPDGEKPDDEGHVWLEIWVSDGT